MIRAALIALPALLLISPPAAGGSRHEDGLRLSSPLMRSSPFASLQTPGSTRALPQGFGEEEAGRKKRRGKAAGEVLEQKANHLAFPGPDQVVIGDMRFAMGFLSVWGAGSTAVGLNMTLGNRPRDGAWSDPASRELFFGGLQHLTWGLADLGIGLGALAGSMSLRSRLKPATNRQMSRIFLVNFLLDIAYLSFAAVALALSEQPGRDAAFWRGTGQGVAVQGGFLLLFDLAAALRFDAHSRRSRGAGR